MTTIRIAGRLTIGGLVNYESIKKYLDEHIKIYIIAREYANREHYHFSFDSEKTVNTLRNHMNRHFKCVKNQSYCMKDKGKYSMYTVKDGEILHNNMFTDQELYELIQKSYTKKGNSVKDYCNMYEPLPFHLDVFGSAIVNGDVLDHVNEYLLKRFREDDKLWNTLILDKYIYMLLNRHYYAWVVEKQSHRVRNKFLT